MLIYLENDYDGQYGAFWGHLGEVITDRPRFLAEPEQFGLVCFTGGDDVSPELYGHKNLGSHNSPARDKRELVIFEMARKHEIPMTGICRGSQFLNVMCGGTMVQHLKANHGGGLHRMITSEGEVFDVTSSHHQMSVVGEGGEYLAWSEESIPIEACNYDGDLHQRRVVQVPEFEGSEPSLHLTEAFAYPKVRIFGCQFHAEWMDIESPAAQWQLQKTREVCFEEGEVTLQV